MTQEEKDTLHIQRQNRLYRKLILSVVQPLMAVLLLISPLLILGIKELRATPSEPIAVTYADCRWENRRLILYTSDNEQWRLSTHLRKGWLLQ